MVQEFLNGTEYVVDCCSFTDPAPATSPKSGNRSGQTIHRVCGIWRYKKARKNVRGESRILYEHSELLKPKSNVI